MARAGMLLDAPAAAAMTHADAHADGGNAERPLVRSPRLMALRETVSAPGVATSPPPAPHDGAAHELASPGSSGSGGGSGPGSARRSAGSSPGGAVWQRFRGPEAGSPPRCPGSPRTPTLRTITESPDEDAAAMALGIICSPPVLVTHPDDLGPSRRYGRPRSVGDISQERIDEILRRRPPVLPGSTAGTGSTAGAGSGGGSSSSKADRDGVAELTDALRASRLSPQVHTRSPSPGNPSPLRESTSPGAVRRRVTVGESARPASLPRGRASTSTDSVPAAAAAAGARLPPCPE